MSNINQIRFYLKKHPKKWKGWRVVMDGTRIAGECFTKKEAQSVCRSYISHFHPQYDWVLCEEKKPEHGEGLYSFKVLAKSKGGLL